MARTRPTESYVQAQWCQLVSSVCAGESSAFWLIPFRPNVQRSTFDERKLTANEPFWPPVPWASTVWVAPPALRFAQNAAVNDVLESGTVPLIVILSPPSNAAARPSRPGCPFVGHSAPEQLPLR